jgi:hypothetical protein
LFILFIPTVKLDCALLAAPKQGRMSAWGHSRRFGGSPIISGLPPGTDIARPPRHVRSVPITEVKELLFDHLIVTENGREFLGQLEAAAKWGQLRAGNTGPGDRTGVGHTAGPFS